MLCFGTNEEIRALTFVIRPQIQRTIFTVCVIYCYTDQIICAFSNNLRKINYLGGFCCHLHTKRGKDIKDIMHYGINIVELFCADWFSLANNWLLSANCRFSIGSGCIFLVNGVDGVYSYPEHTSYPERKHDSMFLLTTAQAVGTLDIL